MQHGFYSSKDSEPNININPIEENINSNLDTINNTNANLNTNTNTNSNSNSNKLIDLKKAQLKIKEMEECLKSLNIENDSLKGKLGNVISK